MSPILKHIGCLLMIGILGVSRLGWAGPEIPGRPQTTPIAIVAATLHTIRQPAMENATLLFENGRITQVGTSVSLPEGTRVIDGTGKHVYPGLFNADGPLGLLEISSVRGTRDMREVGQVNPNVRAEVAVNPDSELIPVTRSGGVLLNLTAPTGGLISGTSAVLQLDGWTWEDLTLHAPAGMHMTWPSLRESRRGGDETADREQRKSRHTQLQRLEDIFAQVEAYDRARSADEHQAVDLRWEAMRPVLTGQVPLVVSADRAAQIQSAVAFCSRRSLRLIIYGGYDAAECAAILRAQNVPVIIRGVYRLPWLRSDPYDQAYTLPARLRKAQVKFCIAGGGRDAANIRNLPHHAAMAVAFGLPEDEAVRAITLSPAEILGVSHRVGSLEPGKDATVIMTDGNVLDTATHVVVAFVQGREVDLSDRHKRLWRKYQARPKQSRRQENE